jgi:hypothetical protein
VRGEVTRLALAVGKLGAVRDSAAYVSAVRGYPPVPEDFVKQAAGFWNRLRHRASDAVARGTADLVRGRTAAHDVFDDAGNLLVGAGRVIDADVIARATSAGKLAALAAAVAAARTQDLKERLQGELDRTPEGQDRRSLADSDEYIEARRYIHYVAAVAVTDVRGNVIVAQGAAIRDEDVRQAREAGQLAALIFTAQQSGPPPVGEVGAGAPAPVAPPRQRTAVPLSGEPEEEA